MTLAALRLPAGKAIPILSSLSLRFLPPSLDLALEWLLINISRKLTLHARGPGFKPHCVIFFSILVADPNFSRRIGELYESFVRKKALLKYQPQSEVIKVMML